MKSPVASGGLRGTEAFQAALGRAGRLVIKIGSSQLVDYRTGEPRTAIFEMLAADIAALRARGVKCVLVSSGAVAFGRHRLDLPLRRALALDEKQAAAAVGQLLLAEAWAKAFDVHGVLTGQALLSPDDTERRPRWLNARNTFERLFDLGVLPIVNENDTVATQELRYGDNDALAGRVTSLVRADGLVLLSDVDGLYTADPALDPAAERIDHIGDIETSLPAIAGPPRKGSAGTGGMASKLGAARIAARAGCWTVIARASDRPLGRSPQIRLTFVPSSATPGNARQAWIAGALTRAGRVTVDDGAAEAVLAGRSLLPAGMTGVKGRFSHGETVTIADRSGSAIAIGLAAYDSDECRLLLGTACRNIGAVLGYRRGAAIVHANDLVLKAAQDGPAGPQHSERHCRHSQTKTD